MRAFFLTLFFIVYLLAGRWFFICQVRQLCDDGQLQEDVRLQTLSLTDGKTIILSGYDHFAFDSAVAAPRLNGNNKVFLDSVAAYLNQQAGQRLKLTGAYRSTEADIKQGFYDNIGLSRANEVRKELMRRGIDQERINLDHREDKTNLLRRPVSFQIQPDDGYEETPFTFTRMSFSDANFEYNSAEFRPGANFVAYADSVKTFMELNTEKELTIVGHTDSIASQAYNYDLGLRRAKSAKEYFRELGLNPKRVDTGSEGKKKPVASNQTEEGRQKNRRVEFIIE